MYNFSAFLNPMVMSPSTERTGSPPPAMQSMAGSSISDIESRVIKMNAPPEDASGAIYFWPHDLQLLLDSSQYAMRSGIVPLDLCRKSVTLISKLERERESKHLAGLTVYSIPVCLRWPLSIQSKRHQSSISNNSSQVLYHAASGQYVSHAEITLVFIDHYNLYNTVAVL